MSRNSESDENRPRGDLEQRIAEELVFERVRQAIDFCELVQLEADLAKIMGRVVRDREASEAECRELAFEYLERAWNRLTRDLLAEFSKAAVDRSDPP